MQIVWDLSPSRLERPPDARGAPAERSARRERFESPIPVVRSSGLRIIAAQLIKQRMSSIKHTIMILSGKGGVGKSTVSSQLAFGLAAQGFQVGILDIDICGPSIPRMMGVLNGQVHQSNSGWDPVYVDDNLSVMSIGFLLNDPNDAVIWRGAKKHGRALCSPHIQLSSSSSSAKSTGASWTTS